MAVEQFYPEGSKPLRVAYVTESPRPYQRPFLKNLATQPELELKVYYLCAVQENRKWRINEPPQPFEKVLPGLHWCADHLTGEFNHFNAALFGELTPKNFDVVVRRPQLP